jgi:hypothetical protein
VVLEKMYLIDCEVIFPAHNNWKLYYRVMHEWKLVQTKNMLSTIKDEFWFKRICVTDGAALYLQKDLFSIVTVVWNKSTCAVWIFPNLQKLCINTAS